MNKIKKLIFTFPILLMFSFLYADNQAALNMMNQAGQKYSQKYNDFYQQMLAKQAATSSTNNQATTTITARCDCYDDNDVNNTKADNFVFDANGVRISRKNPPCKCYPQNVNTPPLSSLIINTPGSTTNGNNNKTKAGSTPATTPVVDFGIKY